MHDHPATPVRQIKKKYRRTFKLRGRGRVLPYPRKLSLAAKKPHERPEAPYRELAVLTAWEVLDAKGTTAATATTPYIIREEKRPKRPTDKTRTLLTGKARRWNYWANTKMRSPMSAETTPPTPELPKNDVPVRKQQHIANPSPSVSNSAPRDQKNSSMLKKNQSDVKASASEDEKPPSREVRTIAEPTTPDLSDIPVKTAVSINTTPAVTQTERAKTITPAAPSQEIQPKTAPREAKKPARVNPAEPPKTESRPAKQTKKLLDSPYLYTALMLIIFFGAVSMIDEAENILGPLLLMLVGLGFGAYGAYKRLHKQQSGSFPIKADAEKNKQTRKMLNVTVTVFAIFFIIGIVAIILLEW